jgi:hypothetical protein
MSRSSPLTGKVARSAGWSRSSPLAGEGGAERRTHVEVFPACGEGGAERRTHVEFFPACGEGGAERRMGTPNKRLPLFAASTS